MPDILNIIRNPWLDDGACFELIAAVPEIVFKDSRDGWVLHYLADIVCNMIAGDFAEANALKVQDGLSDQALYEMTMQVSQDVAERLLRGGKFIVNMIERVYPDEFFGNYVITGAQLLKSGDLVIQYRRSP